MWYLRILAGHVIKAETKFWLWIHARIIKFAFLPANMVILAGGYLYSTPNVLDYNKVSKLYFLNLLLIWSLALSDIVPRLQFPWAMLLKGWVTALDPPSHQLLLLLYLLYSPRSRSFVQRRAEPGWEPAYPQYSVVWLKQRWMLNILSVKWKEFCGVRKLQNVCCPGGDDWAITHSADMLWLSLSTLKL